jgi:hypothetical protein
MLGTPHESRSLRLWTWAPLALGVSAIVVGAVLYSPQPIDEPGPRTGVGDVSASP